MGTGGGLLPIPYPRREVGRSHTARAPPPILSTTTCVSSDEFASGCSRKQERKSLHPNGGLLLYCRLSGTTNSRFCDVTLGYLSSSRRSPNTTHATLHGGMIAHEQQEHMHTRSHGLQIGPHHMLLFTVYALPAPINPATLTCKDGCGTMKPRGPLRQCRRVREEQGRDLVSHRGSVLQHEASFLTLRLR